MLGLRYYFLGLQELSLMFHLIHWFLKNLMCLSFLSFLNFLKSRCSLMYLNFLKCRYSLMFLKNH
jgi:hypothetical protein